MLTIHIYVTNDMFDLQKNGLNGLNVNRYLEC